MTRGERSDAYPGLQSSRHCSAGEIDIHESDLSFFTWVGFEFTTNAGCFWNRNLLLLATPLSMLDIAGSGAGFACKVDHVKIFSVFQQFTYQYDIETMNISFFAIFLPDKGDGSNIVGVVQPCNRSQGQGSVSDSMKPRQGVAVGRHSLSPRRWHRPHNCGLGRGWPPRRSRRRHNSTLVRKSQTSGFRQGCNRSRSHWLR